MVSIDSNGGCHLCPSSLLGEETVTPIIFAPDGSEPILGVLALEGLGISVDPKTRSLKRERAISLK